MKKTIILVLAIAFVFGATVPLAAQKGKGGKSSGRLQFRDMPVVVKSAFDKLDPVFKKNLKPNAAVAVFPVSTGDLNDAEALYTELQLNIVNSGKYLFVEKSKVDALLQEHDFQRSGMVSDATAVSFGKLLDADAVILSAVTGKGAEREFAVIAVDMATRTTLAIVKEPWPQAFEGGGKGRADGRNLPADMGIANVLLLPVRGGTAGDNLTLANLIASLRDINDAATLIDQSTNDKLLPADFIGTRPEDGELMFQLGVQYKANYVISASVEKYGQRNLAVISCYSVYARQTNGVYYLEYIDPIEAWIKLPSVVSAIVKGFTSSNECNIWVRYKDGVDRNMVDKAVQLFITDYVQANDGKEVLVDKTHDFETAIAIRTANKATWASSITGIGKAVPNNNWEAFMSKWIDDVKNQKMEWQNFEPLDPMRELSTDVGINVGGYMSQWDKLIFIEVSKQGNKTRFQLFGGNGSNRTFGATMDFADTRDFIRQMRGLSLTLANGKQTAGYDLGIVQGVKYNYWKYAGEDSFIADITTPTKPFPTTPSKRTMRTQAISTSTLPFHVGLKDYLFYIAEVNDFSKAKLVNTRKYGLWLKTEYHGHTMDSDYNTREIYGLKPGTKYYVWVTQCYGNLVWLQSKPSPVTEVSTRELGRAVGGWN